MKKVSPLVAAIIGAVILSAQQFIGKDDANLKVIGLAVVIAVLGVVSTFLKGKGASLLGIIGTVSYTFYDMYSNGNGHFNWTQFVLTALIAALTVFAPTLIPQPEDGSSTIAKK